MQRSGVRSGKREHLVAFARTGRKHLAIVGVFEADIPTSGARERQIAATIERWQAAIAKPYGSPTSPVPSP